MGPPIDSCTEYRSERRNSLLAICRSPYALLVATLVFTGCLSYAMAALRAEPSERSATAASARTLLPLRAVQQTTAYTCGPAVLVTLLRNYGRNGDELQIARETGCTPSKGTSPDQMAKWLREHGFEVEWGENGSLAALREQLENGRPTIVEWVDWGGHWVLVVGYDTRGTASPRDDLILLADPADHYDGERDGLTSFNALRFEHMWFDAFLFERPMHKVYITAVPKP